jgi:hypothetical protein
MNDHTSEDIANLLWDLRERCDTARSRQLSYGVRADLDVAVDLVWIQCEIMIATTFPPPGTPP